MKKKKRALSVAALWLALIALVFVYTDRDEYRWRYEGDELPLIVRSRSEADEAQAQAEAAMQAEREAAAARTGAGEWGALDEYGDAPETLDAQGEDGGLNLMWGEYEITVIADGAQSLTLSPVSAGRQSFIRGGEVTTPAGGGEATARLTLTDSTQGLWLACALDEGVSAREAGLVSVEVHRVGAGVFSRDLAAWAALCGAVMTALLAFSWDESPRGARRRRNAMVLLGAALFASMPCLWGRLYEGHDLFFHLNRIEGVASGLRGGQLPVRIHASTLLGYGYAAPQFYPELFLYFPAALRLMGVSLTASVLIFEVCINLAAACSAYLGARRVLNDDTAALGASVLYTLCTYRLANLYVRATLGESLAMIFFPLLVAAMVEVLLRDERQWPLLALAMTGIFMSHLLSTMFSVVFCALAAVCCLPRLVREPRRILAILKAAGVMLLCSAWFLVPFLDYARAGISTSVVIDSQENVLQAGSYLVAFSAQSPTLPEGLEDYARSVGVVPGLAILLGCAALLLRRYAKGRGVARDRLCLALAALGALALLAATDAFPWEVLCRMRKPVSTLFMQIQFPWRLVGVAVPLLSMAAAWGYLREPSHCAAGMGVILVLSVLLGGATMQGFITQEPMLAPQDYCDTRTEQYEYTYPGTEKSALEPGYAYDGAQRVALTELDKRGTTLTCVIDDPGRGESIELPLLYYPGYRAQMDGADCRVVCGTNNVLRIYCSTYAERVHLKVWFEPPAAWLLAQGASAAGLARLLLALWRRGRRRA